MDLWDVDAVAGAGKTHAACEFIASLPATNFVVVMPTKKLIKTTIAAFNKRHPGCKGRTTAFYADACNKPVTGRIADHLLKTPPDTGSIIFVTHEAFIRLPHWHLKGAWHVIVDEAMATTYSGTFTLSENRGKLIDLLSVRRDSCVDGYLRVEAADGHGIRAIAQNKRKDQITALFSALASKLIDSSYWHVFVEADRAAWLAASVNLRGIRISHRHGCQPAAHDDVSPLHQRGMHLPAPSADHQPAAL